jgi:hypothetical protein
MRIGSLGAFMRDSVLATIRMLLSPTHEAIVVVSALALIITALIAIAGVVAMAIPSPEEKAGRAGRRRAVPVEAPTPMQPPIESQHAERPHAELRPVPSPRMLESR